MVQGSVRGGSMCVWMEGQQKQHFHIGKMFLKTGTKETILLAFTEKNLDQVTSSLWQQVD